MSDWLPIKTAPRDGTVIEVCCTYGVAPWYGLHKWVDDRYGRRWCDAVDDHKGVDEGPYLSWRAYRGSVADYVDPTGGAQNDDAYWRRAVAVSMVSHRISRTSACDGAGDFARYWSNLKDEGNGVLSARTDADCPVYKCAGPCLGRDVRLGEPDIRCANYWHERRAAWDAAQAREAAERAARPSLWQRLIAKFRRKNAGAPSASSARSGDAL